MSVTIHVWDLPLRIFHWLLAAAVTGAVITGEIGGGWMDWHGRLGILVLGLLVFRILWGIVGSTHARFHNFFPTPAKVSAYLKGQWQGYGHNPLGALSVFALLATLATLVGAGLFSNDDIAFQGPLFSFVDKEFSDKLSGLHERAFNILIALVALHLTAIIYHVSIKKNNIVKPMLTGRKTVPREHAASISKAGAWRLILALFVSGMVVWGVNSGAQYFAPPLSPASSSNW